MRFPERLRWRLRRRQAPSGRADAARASDPAATGPDRHPEPVQPDVPHPGGGGGSAISITAALSSAGTVRWQLAPGAPGSLSADSGNSVSYQPPSTCLDESGYFSVAPISGASYALIGSDAVVRLVLRR